MAYGVGGAGGESQLSQSGGLKFPIVQDEKYKAQIFFEAINGTGGPAILYMPEALSFNDAINYDGVNLGIAGMFAATTAGTVSDIAKSDYSSVNTAMQGLNKSLSAGASSLQEAGVLSGLKDVVEDPVGSFRANAGPLVSLTTQGLSPEAISSGIALGSQITANPHKRSLFRDVGIRNFGFSFFLSPASPAEASAIENIVDFFRVNAYPEYVSGARYAYRFPNKFRITMKYNGGEMSQPPKILDCHLTSINTTFNPRSSSFFSDGKFNETQISLAFVEERALAKPDIQEGY